MDTPEIIKQSKVIIHETEYLKVIYGNGEVCLKRYDEKAKMWVVLRFSQEEPGSEYNVSLYIF